LITQLHLHDYISRERDILQLNLIYCRYGFPDVFCDQQPKIIRYFVAFLHNPFTHFNYRSLSHVTYTRRI